MLGLNRVSISEIGVLQRNNHQSIHFSMIGTRNPLLGYCKNTPYHRKLRYEYGSKIKKENYNREAY